MTGQCIMIASSKGGIGKSTAALGISLALARRSKKVLLCDLDLSNACLDMLTGAEDQTVYNINDIVLRRCSAADALVQPYDGLPLSLIASPGDAAADDTDSADYCKKIALAVEQAAVAANSDFVILDTGAGISRGSSAAALISDKALIVAGHSPLSVRSAERTAQRIRDLGVDDIRLIINSFDSKGVSGGAGRSGIFSIMDASGLPLCGVVPYDYSLALSQEQGKSCSGDAETAFNNIAARICREDVPLFSGMKKMRKMRNKFYR